LLRPRAARLKGWLWAAHAGQPAPAMPPSGTLSFRPAGGEETQGAQEEAFCLAIGYRRFAEGNRILAVRADALERLAAVARKLAAQGSFGATPALQRLVGCSDQDLAQVLAALGYRAESDETGLSFMPRRAGTAQGGGRKGGTGRPRGGGKGTGVPRRPAQADSPFAKLRDLKIEP
jgi:ATP-dependent RNA helicase SUPV3L1/SUV3